MKHHNSPIGRRSTGPHIARKAAAHIQNNAAKPGRDWMGGRKAGKIDPMASVAPPPGGSMPMGSGGGGPPMDGGMGGGPPMGGDEGLGGL